MVTANENKNPLSNLNETMTRLIVISSEKDMPGETELVNELFENGMQLFHLRKPHWSTAGQAMFLDKINPRFITNISIHQHHEHVNDFGLRYVHFNSKNVNNFSLLKKQNSFLKTSFSFHSYAEIEQHHELFDYGFLSPVFDSISKTGYVQQINPELVIDKNLTTKIIGLGGVTKNNIRSLLQRGFYGGAVLGAIWNNPLMAVSEFNEIKNACNTNVHTY
jgi:thiamine-phosphate pyrophosphorylase